MQHRHCFFFILKKENWLLVCANCCMTIPSEICGYEDIFMAHVMRITSRLLFDLKLKHLISCCHLIQACCRVGLTYKHANYFPENY